MRTMKLLTLAVIFMAVSAFAVAQDASTQAPPVVKHVPITNAPADSGQAMFKSYCAVCHGIDSKGNGPAAPAMKTPPADLTTLAQKNGGKYPSAHIATIIREGGLTSHGNQEMPVWGPSFSSISPGQKGVVQLRVYNLVKYIEEIQVK
jgi:mono/diheme cytochrome c family protein